MIYNNLSNLNCGHKACFGCNTLNTNEFCEICEPKECIFCHKMKKIITPSCEHKQCEDCNIIIQQIGFCPECDRSELIFKCDFCLQFNITHRFANCDSHNLCLNCINKQPESCLLCSSHCFYCKETKKVAFPICMHSYCEICINDNTPPTECVFCNNTYESFTCIQCQKVSLNIRTFECSHNFCYQCNSLEYCYLCEKEEICPGCTKTAILKQRKCQHVLCKECLNQESCRVCDPEKFCKECLIYYNNESSDCKHGYCDNCRNTIICKDCLCTACNTKFYNQRLVCGHSFCLDCSLNHECMKYSPNKCKLCDKNSLTEKQDFGQYFCNDCFTNKLYLLCYKINICKLCFSYDQASQKFTCEHDVCSQCILQKKCPECECYVCKNPSLLETANCGHRTCNYCRFSSTVKTCVTCYNSQCQNCKRFYSHKYTKNCEHNGCSHCTDHLYCIHCNPEHFCQLCRSITNDKLCKHFYCYNCRIKHSACDCSCNICNTQDLLYLLKCGHSCCNNCTKHGICINCYKNECERCKRINIKKHRTQYGNLICIICDYDIMNSEGNQQDYCSKCLKYFDKQHFTINEICNQCYLNEYIKTRNCYYCNLKVFDEEICSNEHTLKAICLDCDNLIKDLPRKRKND